MVLKRAQVRPLAVGAHADRNLLQLCYTSEVVDSVFKLLDEAGLPGELRLLRGWRWWRWWALVFAVTRCTAIVSGSN